MLSVSFFIVMLSVSKLNVILLSVSKLNVIMLSVSKPNVIMLSVVTFWKGHSFTMRDFFDCCDFVLTLAGHSKNSLEKKVFW